MRRLVVSTASILASLASLAVTVAVEEPSAGVGRVEWSEEPAEEGMCALALAASAREGYAFSGWLVDGKLPDWGVDARCPSVSGVRVATNAAVTASFIDSADDTLGFDFSDSLSDFACGEHVAVRLFVDSGSFPELSLQGLPAGLSFDAKTLAVSGAPVAPGRSTVVATGRNASGYRFSQTLRLTVDNLSSERLEGEDEKILLGEYYDAEFEDLFLCTGERTSTSLSGLPPGLTWQGDWDLVYGTPTRAGVYVVTATVRFADGKADTATLLMTVAMPDPGDYGVDLDGLEGLCVGDRFDSGDLEIGTYAAGDGITSVSGLPAGLSVETWVDGGVRHYGVVGTATASGLFTVEVVVSDGSGGSAAKVKTSRDVIVSDTPWRYLRAFVADASPEGSGKVSGGGAISVVSGASVTARAADGFVFAGWLDSSGDASPVGEGIDYRVPSVRFAADDEFEFLDMFALFVPKGEDASVEIEGLDGSPYVFGADGWLDEVFRVQSASLPTLTAKGLPAGVSIVASDGGEYRLAYDSESAVRRPAPGRYQVSLSAVNVSGASAAATFLLVVENVVDARIDVEDDFGEYAPDEEIDPIDLSGAVRFELGETLSVSGLPRGLVYNKSANAKKGVDAHTITGTPVAPGYYTLTFTAKVVASASTNSSGRVSYSFATATATAFITVLPYPLVSVWLDDEASAAGNSVAGAGNYKPGAKVTLKAVAAKGWVFAGWDGLWGVDWPDSAKPTISIEADSFDMDVTANFVPVSEDGIEIVPPTDTSDGYAAEFMVGVDVAEGYDASLVAYLVDSVSMPKVKVSGLPPGVKFSPTDFMLSGRPSKRGVYYATVSAENAGGYKFTRILRVAVRDADGALPAEPAPANDAGLDFSPLHGLVTGERLGPGDARLVVGPSPAGGAAPAKVAVTGAPAGLVATVSEGGGGLVVDFTGTPTAVARYAVSVKVTYADRSTLTSKAYVVTEDGGSAYLSVSSLDDSLGTVSGEGVYRAGATVKLSAKPRSKCVFAGWLVEGDGGEFKLFPQIAETDGVDPRTAQVSFPFRPGDFDGSSGLHAAFAQSADDASISIALAAGPWEIVPGEASEFPFSVDSVSLPSVAAKNMPKGVSVDLARGRLVYTPSDSTKSGIYLATLSAQNQSRAKSSASLEIRVANRVSGMIGGLDPSMDAYALSVGVASGAGFIAPEVGEGVKLAVSGLPSGLSFKNGVVSGVPKKAGAYTVTFSATSGSGAGKTSGVATVTVKVAALPAGLSGTFNGYACDDSLGGKAVGTVTATATSAGKISVTVKTDAGTERFSASEWMSFDEASGIARSEMTTKGGSALSLSVDSSAEWSAWQMQGTFTSPGYGGPLRITAQRNPFDANNGSEDARKIAAQLAGTYSWQGLKATVQKTGVVKFSGKYDGRTVSGSTVLMIGEDGGILAKLVVIDVKKGDIVVVMTFDDVLGDFVWKILSE